MGFYGFNTSPQPDENGCSAGRWGQTEASFGVVSPKSMTQYSSFTIFIAVSGMHFGSAPDFWPFWAKSRGCECVRGWSERNMTRLLHFIARNRRFEVHTNPSTVRSAVYIHVLSPFPMSLVYLESQLGVMAIF